VVAIGDDALISSDVWIRNHDMHAIVDLRSGHRVDRAPVDVIVERHVWIGQNAMLLNCQRVGAGAIVGAQSLVKNTVAGCVAVGGVPARLLRSEVSWGRDAVGMTEAERQLVARLHAINGFIAVT
jgi:acetyltransferase-like isoleucine patch superfamily enzyme